MKTYSHSDLIYLGRNAGRDIAYNLSKAKYEVKIVSPYLTPSFIERLLALRRKGVKITLITSDKLEEGDGNYSSLAHSDIIKQKRTTDYNQKRIRDKGMKYAGLSFLLPIVYFALFGFFNISAAITLSVVSVIVSIIVFASYHGMRIYDYEYYSLFRLKVFHSRMNSDPYVEDAFLIHSKIFVIDNNLAYLGSTNYTYSGFKTNYECAIKIKDPNAVKDISEEVERLFHSTKLYSEPVDEWGRRLYSEPPN